MNASVGNGSSFHTGVGGEARDLTKNEVRDLLNSQLNDSDDMLFGDEFDPDELLSSPLFNDPGNKFSHDIEDYDDFAEDRAESPMMFNGSHDTRNTSIGSVIQSPNKHHTVHPMSPHRTVSGPASFSVSSQLQSPSRFQHSGDNFNLVQQQFQNQSQGQFSNEPEAAPLHSSSPRRLSSPRRPPTMKSPLRSVSYHGGRTPTTMNKSLASQNSSSLVPQRTSLSQSLHGVPFNGDNSASFHDSFGNGTSTHGEGSMRGQQMNQQISQHMGFQMNQQMDSQMNEQIGSQMNQHMNQQMGSLMNQQVFNMGQQQSQMNMNSQMNQNPNNVNIQLNQNNMNMSPQKNPHHMNMQMNQNNMNMSPQKNPNPMNIQMNQQMNQNININHGMAQKSINMNGQINQSMNMNPNMNISMHQQMNPNMNMGMSQQQMNGPMGQQQMNQAMNQQVNMMNPSPLATFGNVSIANQMQNSNMQKFDQNKSALAQPPQSSSTLNGAMEKLCESMKRSAMTRSIVKQISGRNVVKQNSSRALLSASGHQRSVRNLMDDSSGRSVSIRRMPGAKHQLQHHGRGMYRHDSQKSLASHNSSHGVNLQIDGRNVGTF